MKNFILLLLTLSIASLAQAQEQAATESSGRLYINIGQANLKKSQMALPPLKFLGTGSLAKNNLKYEKELFTLIERDLSVSSYFSMMSKEAFTESADKGLRPAPVDPNGFDFTSWKAIGAEFLVKVGYNVVGNTLSMEAYVYHVPQRELVLGRSYSAPLKDLRGIGHKFCNDLVEKLAGAKGFFLTKLAVSRSTGKNEKDIFIMDWDGENVRPITNFKTISQSPSWSMDGRYVAYTSFLYHKKKKSRNADLFMYDTKTNQHSPLSARKGINSSAAFLPDGNTAIIRLSPNNGTSDLYKLDLTDKSITPVTNGPRGAMNVEPALTMDGKKLAFSSDRGGRPMIYTMDLPNGPAQRLTYAGYYNSSPAWSPDGKKIAFASYVDGHFDIFVMDSTGKNLTRVASARKTTGGGSNNEDPTFSPDGRFVMFRSDRSGTYQLYIATIDGKNEYRLTFDNHNYYRPQWSLSPN